MLFLWYCKKTKRTRSVTSQLVATRMINTPSKFRVFFCYFFFRFFPLKPISQRFPRIAWIKKNGTQSCGWTFGHETAPEKFSQNHKKSRHFSWFRRRLEKVLFSLFRIYSRWRGEKISPRERKLPLADANLEMCFSFPFHRLVSWDII